MYFHVFGKEVKNRVNILKNPSGIENYPDRVILRIRKVKRIKSKSTTIEVKGNTISLKSRFQTAIYNNFTFSFQNNLFVSSGEVFF